MQITKHTCKNLKKLFRISHIKKIRFKVPSKTCPFYHSLWPNPTSHPQDMHFYLLSYYSLLPNPTLHPQNTSIYCHIILYYPIQHYIHKTLLFIVISFFITQSNITSTQHFYLLPYQSLLPNPTLHPPTLQFYCHIILYYILPHCNQTTLLCIVIFIMLSSFLPRCYFAMYM